MGAGRSCVTSLLRYTHEFVKALDKKNQLDAVFLDYSKAFDSVSFNCLLRELFAVGVRGNLLSWFRSYLTDRWHRTVIDGLSSTWQPVWSGIPQGSILGPWLFIIYMSYFAVWSTPGVGSWPSFILIVHLSTNIARKHELSFHF